MCGLDGQGHGNDILESWSSKVITTRKRGVCGLDGRDTRMTFGVLVRSSKVITTRKRVVCGLDGLEHWTRMADVFGSCVVKEGGSGGVMEPDTLAWGSEA